MVGILVCVVQKRLQSIGRNKKIIFFSKNKYITLHYLLLKIFKNKFLKIYLNKYLNKYI